MDKGLKLKTAIEAVLNDLTEVTLMDLVVTSAKAHRQGSGLTFVESGDIVNAFFRKRTEPKGVSYDLTTKNISRLQDLLNDILASLESYTDSIEKDDKNEFIQNIVTYIVSISDKLHIQSKDVKVNIKL